MPSLCVTVYAVVNLVGVGVMYVVVHMECHAVYVVVYWVVHVVMNMLVYVVYNKVRIRAGQRGKKRETKRGQIGGK